MSHTKKKFHPSFHSCALLPSHVIFLIKPCAGKFRLTNERHKFPLSDYYFICHGVAITSSLGFNLEEHLDCALRLSLSPSHSLTHLTSLRITEIYACLFLVSFNELSDHFLSHLRWWHLLSENISFGTSFIDFLFKEKFSLISISSIFFAFNF